MPPPFTHFYTLTAEPLPDGAVGVTYSITYTDRDDLDPDELVAEGFTGDDDFDWRGQLPAVWQAPLADLLGATRLQPLLADKLPDNRDFFELTVGPDQQSGQPANQSDWQYLAQELIQAIYEAAGRERPFELTYLEVQRAATVETRLIASFARREVTLRTGGQTSTLPWADLQPLMQDVFGVQYLYEEALPKPPKREGQYLNLGDENWFDLSRAVADLDAPGAVGRLRRTLRQLAR